VQTATQVLLLALVEAPTFTMREGGDVDARRWQELVASTLVAAHRPAAMRGELRDATRIVRLWREARAALPLWLSR